MVIGGGSYLSQSPYTVGCAFPPEETLKEAEIRWPSGIVQVITELTVNRNTQILEIRE